MWLSKKIAKNNRFEKAEKGSVTIAGEHLTETDASANARDISAYAPYGYTCAVPVGEEVLLVPSSDGQVALGTRRADNTLERGEVKITSRGGASIVLKNDGSVIINSLVIDRNGGIENDI